LQLSLQQSILARVLLLNGSQQTKHEIATLGLQDVILLTRQIISRINYIEKINNISILKKISILNSIFDIRYSIFDISPIK